MTSLLILVGPTASGKTEIAVELSKHLPVEVISCDSMQAYKGMPITTQAPPKKSLSAVRTHLVAFLNPSEEYNAAIFRKEAVTCIEKILKNKKTPLIVGGTGLYLRALLDGLFEDNEKNILRDEALRKRLLSEEKIKGAGTLHKKLREVDSATAKKIHPNDLRRIVRALEIFYLSGQPFSKIKSQRSGIRDKWPHRIFLLEHDRKELYERINQRVEKMFRQGLVHEVKRLSKKRLSQTAQMALGIREVKAYLEGTLTLEQAKELLKRNTRHYAKRQLSWFRHECGVEPVTVRAGESAREIAERLLANCDLMKREDKLRP